MVDQIKRETRYGGLSEPAATRTYVHFNVGLLRVHVTVVVARVTRLHVSHVVALRNAVHQVSVELVRVPEDFRGDNRSVTSEGLQSEASEKREILCELGKRKLPSPRYDLREFMRTYASPCFPFLRARARAQG